MKAEEIREWKLTTERNKILAEIAAQLAEANEARSRIDTFEFGGVEFRRDAIVLVGPIREPGFYCVEVGSITADSGGTFRDAEHPRSEFIRAWKGK